MSNVGVTEEQFRSWMDNGCMGDVTAYGLYKQALERWGHQFQVLILAEEASELATAAIHHLRGDSLEKVAEEIADVLIMIEQMYVHDGPDFWADVLEFRAEKLERLRKRLEADMDIGRDNDDLA